MATSDAAPLIFGYLFPYKGRTPDLQKPVRVYRNLHAKVPEERWSVQQDGLVVAHAAVLMLRDVKFLVSKRALSRSRQEGRKVVCAFAEGYLTDSGMGITATEGIDLPVKVVFDRKEGAFVRSGSNAPVRTAAAIRLNSCLTAAYCG